MRSCVQIDGFPLLGIQTIHSHKGVKIVTRLIMVIILKCTEILNHYVVYQELTQCCRSIILQKQTYWGFPGVAVVKNLPANAGDTGSSPGLGRSHMTQSNQAREPQLLSLRVWSLCSATGEAATVRGLRTTMKSGPRSPQLDRKSTRLNSSHT